MKRKIGYAEARSKIIEGAQVLARAVGCTIGPRGRNVVIEKPFGPPRVTKDGVTVAKSIELADKHRELGVRLLREAAEKTAAQAGDGTSTTVLIAAALLQYAEDNTADLARISRELPALAEQAVSLLSAMAQPIDSRDAILKVAKSAANHDEELAEAITEGVMAVGKDGLLTVTDSKEQRTKLVIKEGLAFAKGYLNPRFADDFGRCELERPLVLILHEKVHGIRPFVPLLDAVAKEGRSLLFLCDHMHEDDVATMVRNHREHGLRCCVVQAPSFGDRRTEHLLDIAIATGGQVSDQTTGLRREMLGECGRVVVLKDRTTLYEPSGDTAAVEKHVARLRAMNPASDYDKEKLAERIGALVGGIAEIAVGGWCEAEAKEQKDRAEDALLAVRAAIDKGVVPGGSAALVAVGRRLEGRGPAYEAMRVALRAPLRKIASNAGMDPSYVTSLVEMDGQPRDVSGDQPVPADLIDPATVLVSSVRNACSIAATLLLVEAALTN